MSETKPWLAEGKERKEIKPTGKELSSFRAEPRHDGSKKEGASLVPFAVRLLWMESEEMGRSVGGSE